MPADYCPNNAGIIEDLDEVQALLPYPVAKMYGRKMCAVPDCHGVVLCKADGSLRKHVKGSNR